MSQPLSITQCATDANPAKCISDAVVSQIVAEASQGVTQMSASPAGQAFNDCFTKTCGGKTDNNAVFQCAAVCVANVVQMYNKA